VSTWNESTDRRDLFWIYVVCGGVVVILMVLGVIFYNNPTNNTEAKMKASQLIGALDQAGYHSPTTEQVVNTLGTDGGAVCANPNKKLSRAILLSQLMNGGTGPGQRPVIVDRRVIAGQLLIMKIYCPDQLTMFQSWVTGLKFGDVAG
jgi:hypothetical protein